MVLSISFGIKAPSVTAASRSRLSPSSVSVQHQRNPGRRSLRSPRSWLRVGSHIFSTSFRSQSCIRTSKPESSSKEGLVSGRKDVSEGHPPHNLQLSVCAWEDRRYGAERWEDGSTLRRPKRKTNLLYQWPNQVFFLCEGQTLKRRAVWNLLAGSIRSANGWLGDASSLGFKRPTALLPSPSLFLCYDHRTTHDPLTIMADPSGAPPQPGENDPSTAILRPKKSYASFLIDPPPLLTQILHTLQSEPSYR